MYLCVN